MFGSLYIHHFVFLVEATLSKHYSKSSEHTSAVLVFLECRATFSPDNSHNVSRDFIAARFIQQTFSLAFCQAYIIDKAIFLDDKCLPSLGTLYIFTPPLSRGQKLGLYIAIMSGQQDNMPYQANRMFSESPERTSLVLVAQTYKSLYHQSVGLSVYRSRVFNGKEISWRKLTASSWPPVSSLIYIYICLTFPHGGSASIFPVSLGRTSLVRVFRVWKPCRYRSANPVPLTIVNFLDRERTP